MPSTIDSIVESFPHPTIHPITGVPTYESIAELNLQLNANAASVQSNLGDGKLGLLYLTISPEEYDTLSAVAFVPPVNPGTGPAIPIAATASQITALMRQHATNLQLFKEYNGTDKALKQQVIGAVNSMYLRALAHRITGFANVTTLTMLKHLYKNYGRLSPADLQDNDTRMRTKYDPNQPIEILFDQVEDSISLAAAGQAPYTPAQIVSIAYNLVFNTGLFPEACREWRRRTDNDKIWLNFKVDFTTAHQEWRDSQVTSNQVGYHNANATLELQQDTAIAIANLATATASDRSTVSNLSSTNSALTADLALANSKLQEAQATIATLTHQVTTLRGRNGHSNRRAPNPNSNQQVQGNKYCWTHGYRVGKTHDSASCLSPAHGHQTTATRCDNMGGSQLGKG